MRQNLKVGITEKDNIAYLGCYMFVSSVVLCCCIAALEEVVCQDDVSHCITAGRVAVSPSLPSLFAPSIYVLMSTS